MTTIIRVFASVALAIWSAAGISVVTTSPYVKDPTLFCYVVKPGQQLPPGALGLSDKPWSCYQTDDRPADLMPIWVGPQSEIVTASIPYK